MLHLLIRKKTLTHFLRFKHILFPERDFTLSKEVVGGEGPSGSHAPNSSAGTHLSELIFLFLSFLTLSSSLPHLAGLLRCQDSVSVWLHNQTKHRGSFSSDLTSRGTSHHVKLKEKNPNPRGDNTTTAGVHRATTHRRGTHTTVCVLLERSLQKLCHSERSPTWS